MTRIARSRRAVALAAVAAVVASSHAAVTTKSVPLAPHGVSNGGSVGVVTPLSSTSLLVLTNGPDGIDRNTDDTAVLVTGADLANPTVTAVTIGGLSDWSGSPVRLSATSVLLLSAGADNAFNTADDAIVRLDRIGSGNRVTGIPVGFLSDTDAGLPVLLDADTAVVATFGPDGIVRNADDRVAVITGLAGDTPTVDYEAAPVLTGRGSGRPVPLSPRSFLVAANGSDFTEQSADDEIYLFTKTGNNWSREDLPTPFLTRYGAGTPVALSPGTAVVAALGPDGIDRSADDVVLLLAALDTANGNNATVTPIGVPSIERYGAGRCVRIDATTVLVSTEGPDSASRTADDTVAVLTDLGTTNTVTHITVGYLDDDANCRATPLGPDSFALGTCGPDASWETADDQIAVVSGYRTATPTIVRHSFSAISEGSSSIPLVLGPDALAFGNAGPDGSLADGSDDRLTVLTAATTASPVAEHLDFDGHSQSFYAAAAPQLLGAGRAACAMGGADNSFDAGADDVVQVFEGLPSTRALVVTKAKLTFFGEIPEKGEKCSVKGTLVRDGHEPFGGLFVTVSVGNAAQVLPVSAFTYRKGTWKYIDPKNQNGWVKKVQFKEKSGALQIVGKGLETGMETTDSAFVAVALEGNDLHLGQVVVGTAGAKGISYKAPK